MPETIIGKQSGKAFYLHAGDFIEIVDIEGGQVADLFAVCADNTEETFSAGLTITMNRRHPLRPTTGDILYSTLYRPMLSIVADDVGVHNILVPCCRAESYAARGEVPHPNCLASLNRSFAAFGIAPFPAIQPLSLFMNTEVTPEQAVRFRPPVSRAGDSVAFRAMMNLIVGVTACSDDVSLCNNGRCKPVMAVIREGVEHTPS